MSQSRHSSGWKWLLILVLLAGAGGGAYVYYRGRTNSALPDFRTAKITRGDIVQSVTANGQLTPVRNVEVGSQVSGILTEVNVDFNSVVKQGQVLAKIDPATYERALARAEAELANSKASLELAKFNFQRAKELFAAKLISETEYTQTEVSLHQAEANVKIREASVESAKVDLDRTTIYAPIDGVVITRSIEVGQTVASSFNTPRLFIIANDLTKMQIDVLVSEADVGGVETNQRVNFTVEAFRNRQFTGIVKQVRYQAITNQNVVNYTAVVEVDNPDMKLRPGMTANATIVTAERKNALRIPNTALRFTPPKDVVVKQSTNALAVASDQTKKTEAPQIATTGPFAGLPTPPWTAERRRPTEDERVKYEASLTPEQLQQYRAARDRMRQRMAEGGFGEGGGRGGGFGEGGGRGGFGGGFGFGGSGGSRSLSEGPTTRTVYVVANASTNDVAIKAPPLLEARTVKLGITDGSNTEVLDGLNEGDVVVSGLAVVAAATPAAPAGGTTSPFGGPFGGGRRGR
jgi:HlyD family secretion protein